MKKKLGTIILVFILISCVTASVNAYTVNLIPNSRAIYYSFHSSVSTTERTAIESARSTWNTSAGNEQIYKNSTDHTGTITVGDNKNTVAFVDYSTIGYPTNANAATPLVRNSSNRMVNFDVLFNSLMAWSNGGDLDRQGIAAHELGHVLGLDEYPTTYSGSIGNIPTMWPYSEYFVVGPNQFYPCSNNFRTLTTDDQNGKSYIASQIN